MTILLDLFLNFDGGGLIFLGIDVLLLSKHLLKRLVLLVQLIKLLLVILDLILSLQALLSLDEFLILLSLKVLEHSALLEEFFHIGPLLQLLSNINLSN